VTLTPLLPLMYEPLVRTALLEDLGRAGDITTDAIVPAVTLGVAVSRLGCFLNGDDYGTPSNLPWAVAFPMGTEAYSDHWSRGWINGDAATSLTVHPVQIYASLFALALFVFLTHWHGRRPGSRFAVFLSLYGAGRFADQFVRGDFQPILGPFSLTQLISIALILAGVFLLLRLTVFKVFASPIAIGSLSRHETP